MSLLGAFFVLIAILFVMSIFKSRHDSNYNTLQVSSYKDHILSIKKRDSCLERVIQIAPHYSSTVSYKPEEYVYTGATVGGITTGGIHKEGGYNYISSSKKTEKCELYYEYNETQYIDKIQLTPELAEEARKCEKIKSYVNSQNQIVIYSTANVSSIDKELFLQYGKSNSAGMYNIANKYADQRAPSREKCEAIVSWICGKNPY